MRPTSQAAPCPDAGLCNGALTYGLFLPLFEWARRRRRGCWRAYADDSGEPTPARGAWAAEARSQASIATSCALMAKSMLQTSERRNRLERLSRL